MLGTLKWRFDPVRVTADVRDFGCVAMISSFFHQGSSLAKGLEKNGCRTGEGVMSYHM